MNFRWRISWLFWVGLGITFCCSLVAMASRHRVEASNRAYAISVESTVAEALNPGLSVIHQIAQEIKDHGIGAVVLQEQTLGELVQKGELKLDRTDAGWQVSGRAASLPEVTQHLPLVGTFDQINSLPAGYHREWTDAAKKAGLLVITRFPNRDGMDLLEIQTRLGVAKQAGAWGFLPMGDHVPGAPKSIKIFAEELEKSGILYLTPEFSKIIGDNTVSRLIPKQTLRLHSIQQAESDRLAIGGLTERMSKGLSERNMRVILLRPITGIDWKTQVQQIHATAQKEKLAPREPRPFAKLEVPILIHLMISLGIACAAAGLVMRSVPNKAVRAGLMVACAFLLLFPAKFLAPIGAMLFPIGGFLWLRGKNPHWVIALGILFLTALTGGFLICGLLSSNSTLVKAESFFGVKPVQFLPLFLVGCLAIAEAKPVREILDNKITLRGLVVGSVVFVLLAYMASRTGNDGPGGVSEIELALRALLEKFLVIRPRTKEFLIGYPLLVFGLIWRHHTLLRKGELLWPNLVVAAGFIALTSVVNTFSHLHTPLLVGVLRTFIALLLGTFFGIALWYLARPSLIKMEKQHAS